MSDYGTELLKRQLNGKSIRVGRIGWLVYPKTYIIVSANAYWYAVRRSLNSPLEIISSHKCKIIILTIMIGNFRAGQEPNRSRVRRSNR